MKTQTIKDTVPSTYITAALYDDYSPFSNSLQASDARAWIAQLDAVASRYGAVDWAIDVIDDTGVEVEVAINFLIDE
jgi:hypothetical protein